MELVFPEFRDRIEPFAFDWLGRHFAPDRGRVANGSAQVLMLKGGVGEAMQGGGIWGGFRSPVARYQT